MNKFSVQIIQFGKINCGMQETGLQKKEILKRIIILQIIW